MATSPRKLLSDALTPHLGGVKIVPNSRNIDALDKPIVQISLMEFSRLPQAPIGKHLVTFTVTVVTPLTTPVKAEDDLDKLVGDLIDAIDQIEWLDWESARKVIYSDRHLAYDVTVHAVSEKN